VFFVVQAFAFARLSAFESIFTSNRQRLLLSFECLLIPAPFIIYLVLKRQAKLSQSKELELVKLDPHTFALADSFKTCGS